MSFCAQIISGFEGTGLGIQWSTIASVATPDDNLTFLDCLGMLVLDTFLLLLLTWYIEAVRPGEYGVPLPWYFPFTVRHNILTYNYDYQSSVYFYN